MQGQESLGLSYVLSVAGGCSLALRKWFFFIAFSLWVGPAHGVAAVNTGLAGDDSYAGPFPIGFEFDFFGKRFTSFYVSTNGLLQFSSASADYVNGARRVEGALCSGRISFFTGHTCRWGHFRWFSMREVMK